ncbi:hypothetical protein TNCV_3788201 [Trichonephila clavipes]|nr:hypothetical protein TNCV_3788201 [Trichonephila clavipes]
MIQTSPPSRCEKEDMPTQRDKPSHLGVKTTIVLVHIIVQVVRQAVVIQIPEMGQYFQIDRKKSQLFKNFPLIRALDDNEASVSLGQVTKLAPDAEIRYSRGTDPGR